MVKTQIEETSKFTNLYLCQPRHRHGTHELPPQDVHDVFKTYQAMRRQDLDADSNVVDFNKGLSEEQTSKIRPAGSISAEVLREACETFKSIQRELGLFEVPDFEQSYKDVVFYSHDDFPGGCNFWLRA